MACGALLRRNKVNLDHLNFSAHCISRAHNLGHGHSTKLRAFTSINKNDNAILMKNCGLLKLGLIRRGCYENNIYGHGRVFTSFTHDHKNDNATVMMNCGLLKLGLFRRSCYGNIIYGYGNCKIEFTRTASQFVRFASTNTQQNLVLNHDKRNWEELAAKKIVDKEYLDSDQAVEGSSGKKANRWQESYNVAFKVLRRVWSAISGIGTTLRAVASMSRYNWVLTFKNWIIEFHHLRGIYLVRYELMFLSAKITLRLLIKISCGKRLSKRERQLLTQSTADLFSLVPVSMFNFVQFIEFTLPVFLKLYPSMIPPTSQDKMIEQEPLKRKFRRYQPISNEDILIFARLYNDELTLDNISIAQLVNMCNCMGIPPCGTDEYLRLMLRKRLKI